MIAGGVDKGAGGGRDAPPSETFPLKAALLSASMPLLLEQGHRFFRNSASLLSFTSYLEPFSSEALQSEICPIKILFPLKNKCVGPAWKISASAA